MPESTPRAEEYYTAHVEVIRVTKKLIRGTLTSGTSENRTKTRVAQVTVTAPTVEALKERTSAHLMLITDDVEGEEI